MADHVPVLLEEVLQGLDPKSGETWIDATTGAAGHSARILDRLGPTGRLICIDQDPAMLQLAQAKLTDSRITWVHANFDQLAEVLQSYQLPQVDGLLADLGFSSDQMNNAERGMSFRQDGPLDMRMDPTLTQTAADILNRYDEKELADLFFEYGEERKSRWVAKRVVERRGSQKWERTGELAELVRKCVPRSGGIDPATRVFQALRIAVNDELGVLERLLNLLPNVIRPGGRVGIISFHSLEDRRVKLAFKKEVWQMRTKKPVEASAAEIAQNSRSRSAKLRVAIRV